MDNLKNIRQEKGLSVQYMADKLGINRSSYWRYENGKRKVDIDTLKKIAEILEVSVEKII